MTFRRRSPAADGLCANCGDAPPFAQNPENPLSGAPENQGLCIVTVDVRAEFRLIGEPGLDYEGGATSSVDIQANGNNVPYVETIFTV